MRTLDPQVELVRKACQYIHANPETTTTLADIGKHVGLSPFHLQRVFKRVMGITPREYAESHRLARLKTTLRECSNVTTALYDAGYSSSSRVYERSSEHLGMTPATYRKGGEGMVINFVIVDCGLGRLLVGQTERGICSVHLGRNDDELIETLYREYPMATIQRNQFALCDWVEQIVEHLNGWRPHLDLPMDVAATAFQWKVWMALRDIPYGETRTYREIAEALGLPPSAASAVARASYDNPLAILIPCHRVERADGEPSARYTERARFSWEALHQLEQRQQADVQENQD